MVTRVARRQRVRKGLLLGALLLFPVVMNYLSPYVIIDGASQGIVNGSLIVFGGLFVSALFFGRLWCGWACPGGGLEEALFAVNDRPLRTPRLRWVKWAIWAPWVGIIAWAAISAGGYHRVDVFHLTEGGISLLHPYSYIVYYAVVLLFTVPALSLGRRAACRGLCWMAPFMIAGRALRNRFRWPALRLQADAARCTGCGTCTRACPMSLPVQELVQAGGMEHSECILCGSCVDGCPSSAIRYTFRRG